MKDTPVGRLVTLYLLVDFWVCHTQRLVGRKNGKAAVYTEGKHPVEIFVTLAAVYDLRKRNQPE